MKVHSKFIDYLFGTIFTLLASHFDSHNTDISNYNNFLPLIRRVIDPGYAPLDLHINANFPFGPRSTYASLVAFLTSFMNLSASLYFLRLFCYATLAFVIFRLCQKTLAKSIIAFPLATFFFFCIRDFQFAHYGHLQGVSPALLSLTFTCFFFYLLLERRPFWIISLGMLGCSLLHPVIGIICGLIFILSYLCANWHETSKLSPSSRASLAFAGLLFLTGCYYFWGNFFHESLDDHTNDIFYILTCLRIPHHIIFSSLYLHDHYMTICYLALSIAATFFYLYQFGHRSYTSIILVSTISVLLMLVPLAYITTEFFSNRVAATLIVSRFLLFYRFISFLLLALVLDRLIRSFKFNSSVYALIKFSTWAVVLTLLLYQRKELLAQNFFSLPDVEKQLEFSDEKVSAIARVTRTYTEKESFILTPPYFDPFRAISERAVFFSFKGFPFSESAMLEWANRYQKGYGPFVGCGWPEVYRLNKKYKEIMTYEHIKKLSRSYPITHVILHNTDNADQRLHPVSCTEDYCLYSLEPY